MKYGVPPKLLTSTDTCQLLSLMVADQVLRDSFGGRFDHVSRDRVGCVLGVCSGLELVGEMAGTPAAPGVRQDAARARPARGRGAGHLGRHREPRPRSGTRARSRASSTTSSPGRIANHFDLGGPNFTTDAACASSFAAVAMAVAHAPSRTTPTW